MNYASLVAGSVALFSIIYYFVWGKEVLHGPDCRYWRRLIMKDRLVEEYICRTHCAIMDGRMSQLRPAIWYQMIRMHKLGNIYQSEPQRGKEIYEDIPSTLIA